uniref:Chitin-binding type-2 domain-containing protein n=1 Tax=Glossina brevipalpis TaxID=37001 RepID=A0A1A9WRI6_9MUSC
MNMRINIALLALQLSTCCAITCPPNPACPTPSTCPTATTCPPCTPSTTSTTSASPPTGPSGIYCQPGEKCIGQPDGTTFPDEESNGYIVCQCGCDILLPCPTGTAFNEELHICDHIPSPCPPPSECPSLPECPEQQCPPCEIGPSGIGCHAGQQCFGQPDGTMFPLKEKNGFIVCQCECDIERPCPEGTAYDSDLKACTLIHKNNITLSEV